MKEIKNNKKTYLLLAAILVAAFFLRVYRVGQILGFYFDQGRDALVVWDLLATGKPFLIGPTTGIAGIFRGPFYYYLITPFYLLGGGNPTVPSIFLALTSVLSIALMYHIARVTLDRQTGIIATILASFSFYIVLAGRWLSNPTPMLLLSMLLVYVMLAIAKEKPKSKKLNYLWPAMSAILGTSLFHFGSSGEFFYFLATAIFVVWQKSKFPNFKQILTSGFIFLITASPLILFDLRHDAILSGNIKKFFVDDQSFKATFWEVAKLRFAFYYDVFTNKLFDYRGKNEVFLLSVVAISAIYYLPTLLKKKGFVVTLILLISPMIGLLFFQGNYGNIYDYYLTGYYMIFILGVSFILGKLWKNPLGKVFVIIFIAVFLRRNLELLRFKLADGVDGPQSIGFKNQKQAIDWIYADANKQSFSVDTYVPPVIPYAYEYLYKWYGGRVKGYEPSSEQINPLYTIYEVDPPHPERLEAWLKRQDGIGKVENEAVFGGITVQKRIRYQNK